MKQTELQGTCEQLLFLWMYQNGNHYREVTTYASVIPVCKTKKKKEKKKNHQFVFSVVEMISKKKVINEE